MICEKLIDSVSMFIKSFSVRTVVYDLFFFFNIDTLENQLKIIDTVFPQMKFAYSFT